MQEKFRPFTQFHTATEHDQFLRNMAKERALRLRIRELIKYRRNGLTRHEDCIEYERLRYFREKRKEARLERQRRKSVRFSCMSELSAYNVLSAPCLLGIIEKLSNFLFHLLGKSFLCSRKDALLLNFHYLIAFSCYTLNL